MLHFIILLCGRLAFPFYLGSTHVLGPNLLGSFIVLLCDTMGLERSFGTPHAFSWRLEHDVCPACLFPLSFLFAHLGFYYFGDQDLSFAFHVPSYRIY